MSSKSTTAARKAARKPASRSTPKPRMLSGEEAKAQAKAVLEEVRQTLDRRQAPPPASPEIDWGAKLEEVRRELRELSARRAQERALKSPAQQTPAPSMPPSEAKPESPVAAGLPRLADIFDNYIDNLNELGYAEIRVRDILKAMKSGNHDRYDVGQGFAIVSADDDGKRGAHVCFLENGNVRILYCPVYDESDPGPEYRSWLFGNIRERFQEHPNADSDA
jgi:hypothetical protein